MKSETTNGQCKELDKCIELLNLIMDNEALPEQESFIDQHLENCACCLKQYEVEKEIRSLVKKKLQNKEVPVDLIASIKNKIAAAH